MTPMIHLSSTDLVLAGLLMILNGTLSLLFHLRLQQQILIATVRMVVQLILIGWILNFLFTSTSLLWTALAAVMMIMFAGHEIFTRQDRRFKGFWAYGLGTSCMLFAALLVTTFALSTQLRPDPWFNPQFSIPILGIILGNTMTGISLGLQTLTTSIVREHLAVEAQLTLGRTRYQAMLPLVRRALRNALMPILNMMAATGVVALPGMMSGQIISGVAPFEAVKYQILIMFLVAGGTGIGSITAVLGGMYRLSDERHRLRLDRLTLSKTEGKH